MYYLLFFLFIYLFSSPWKVEKGRNKNQDIEGTLLFQDISCEFLKELSRLIGFFFLQIHCFVVCFFVIK